MGVVVRVFPNGEISQGVATSRRRDDSTHPLGGIYLRDNGDGGQYVEMQCRHGEKADSGLQSLIGRQYWGLQASIWTIVRFKHRSVVFNVKPYKGKRYVKEVQGSLEHAEAYYHLEAVDPLPPPLGSSFAAKLDKASSSPRKQCEKMTKAMARNIRNGVYLMEQRHGTKNLSFITLTMPSLSVEAHQECLRNWGQICNRFFKKLSYHYKKRTGANIEYVYCVEIQPQRYKKSGVYAPHIHAVVTGRSPRLGKKWVFTPTEIRGMFVQVLKCYISEDFCQKAIENVQAIKKSASGYLAKYMGKGTGLTSSCGNMEDVSLLKTQWGGMSRNICKLIRACIQRFDSSGSNSDIAVMFVRHVDLLVRNGILKYWKRGYIPLYDAGNPNGERCLKVGVGCLTTPAYVGGCSLMISHLYAYENSPLD